MFSGLGISAMDDIIKLDFDKIRRIGSDIFITAYPEKNRLRSLNVYRYN